MRRGSDLGIGVVLVWSLCWGCRPAGEEAALRVDSNDGEEILLTLRKEIHSDLPKFSFQLLGSASDRLAEKRKVYSIVISRDDRNQPVQIIEQPEMEVEVGDDQAGLEVLDINLDGYSDIRLLEFSPAGPNLPYRNWVFDPTTETFVSSPEFDRITSPVFDRDRKQVKSSWRDGAATYGNDTYEIVGGKPVLVRREIKRYSEPGAYESIISERVDGDLRTVEQKTVRE